MKPAANLSRAPESEIDEEDFGPSKSQIKRQMLARQELAKIKTFGAIKRHKLYLGKLMRSLDESEINAIEARLDAIQGVNQAEIARMHYLEKLRADLMIDDQRFTELINQYPNFDIQTLRTLIRNARKEQLENKPPKSFREIFQVLKQLDQAPTAE